MFTRTSRASRQEMPSVARTLQALVAQPSLEAFLAQELAVVS